MNIAIFTNAYKPIINGVVNAVEGIRQGLEAGGHQVYIFAPAYRGYHDPNGKVFRFRSVNLLSRLDFPFAVPYSQRVKRFLAPLALDLIHTQHPFLLGVYGARLARRLGLPLVYTFHTQYEQYAHYVPLGINQELVRRVTRKLIKDYAARCHCIITPAPSIRDLLLDYGITARIEVIPNAIDLSAFQRSAPETLRTRLSLSPPVLLYVGRMAKEKNLPFMLDAFREILSAVPTASLLLVGGGPWEEGLQEEIRKRGLNRRTIMTGYVPYHEIPHYMALGDLLLMTSTSEVKPLALLEAMASGLPIVAVDAPGAGDTVTSGVDGLLTPLSVAAFSRAVIRVLGDPALRRKLSLQARETALQYSIQRVTERLLDVYRSLLSRP